MDYKVENLKEKVYKGFIRGEYGEPKIPTPNEVIKKIESFTDTSYSPLLEKTRISEFDYTQISGKFSKVIDDIDILFESIEDESRDILDQITASIKEHNGIKRELRRIRAKTDDIVNRKLGQEYLGYNFTESFDDTENINTVASDPIDTDAGIFSILSSSSSVLSLPHYRDRKLEFNVVETFSNIIENGYLGETNATSILDKDDPRSISYRIKTQSPTRLKVALALQLLPDGKSTDINAVGISLDSSLTKGYIRLYYQQNFQWKDVPALSIQEVKGDSVLFTFPKVSATHIKFEFIKEYPDITATNEYIITIHEVSILKSSNRKEARLYSKPIIIDQYSNETPVIDNISCVIDADVPDGCGANVYVAQDILLSGQFVDANNLPVLADSLEAVNFDPLASGTVYLSDIMSREGVNGLDQYRGFDFNWNKLKPAVAFGNAVPEIIEFNNSTKHRTILNSLYNIESRLFGDSRWPQYTGLYGTIFVSGWCNSDNPMWVPFLSGAVTSGWFISGIDVAAIQTPPIQYSDIEDSSGNIHPVILSDSNYSGQWLGYKRGFPFNYYDEEKERVWKFNDYNRAINGWWRPFSIAVRPEGIDEAYGSGGYLDHNLYGTSAPDFYLNGIKFYKVYKFGTSEHVIDSSIKLYTYETRPVGLETDFYDHNFIWKYRSIWSIETRTSLDAKDLAHYGDSNFSGYSLTLPKISSANEEYVVDGIKEVRLHNTNLSFQKNIDYIISSDSKGQPSGIMLYPLSKNYSYLKPNGVSFDIIYNYRIKNKYSSTWTSFAIVSPNTVGSVTVRNPKIWTKTDVETQKRIIDKISIEDLDTGLSSDVYDEDGKLTFKLDASESSTDKHFKVVIYCASDEETGFCARYTRSTATYFIPSKNKGLINVSKGIKFVSRLESIKLVDLSTLVYDTPMSNDKRCALITDYNNEKYLVAKIPSKDIFQGYYFDSISGYYYYDSRILIKNIGHFVRQTLSDTQINYFTTGSSGTIVYDPWNRIDTSWNAGSVLSEYPNTDTEFKYANHSTYGYPITLSDASELKWRDLLTSGSIDLRSPNISSALVGSPEWSGWISTSVYSGDLPTYIRSVDHYSRPVLYVNTTIPNRGYLFYSTGENLPSFYSISYRTVKNTDSSYSRFVYKIELSSDSDRSVIPKVRSIRFRINEAS